MMPENNKIIRNEQLTRKATTHVQSEFYKTKDDAMRQKYHFEVPAGWCNDPNGLSMYNGEYHLFYQHMPYSTTPGDFKMYWGHAKSDDLITWQHLPVAIAPTEPYDIGGCWSGSGVQVGDAHVLMYTGINGNNSRQVQCMAVSRDGLRYEKAASNPILNDTLCDAEISNFRDPKIWWHNGSWYMVVGSSKDNFGRVVLYRSDHLTQWSFVGNVVESLGELGTICECPNLFELDGRYVLFNSPHGLNQRKSVYLVGDLDYKTGRLFWDRYGEIDWGMDYYAPQVVTGKDGSRLMIGWQNSWFWMPWQDDEYDTAERGWCGGMALPRTLSLNEKGNLKSVPVEELHKLRGEETDCGSFVIEDAKAFDFKIGNGVHCEFELEVQLNETNADEIELELRSDGENKILIQLNLRTGTLVFDRTQTPAKHPFARSCPLQSVTGATLRLHVFMDTTAIELFTDDYTTNMSNNIYLPLEATGMCLRVKGGHARVNRLRGWSMGETEKKWQ